MDFVCPICRGTLTVDENRIKRCSHGHSFDRARQGYYNYLVGSSGGTHGDNADMVLARRAFLGAGYYAPLRERISAIVSGALPSCGAVLDVGCGEGYYTTGVSSTLAARGDGAEVLAFDISREAVRRLAPLDRSISAAVASAYSMPIADESIDLAMLVFSPLAREEIHRILRTGGSFVMAIPAENHLFGLKSAIYKTPYKNTVEDSALEGFTLVSSERISYNITLKSKDEIRSLFMMTPYAYRTGREERERLLSLDTLETQVEFILFVYEKNES